MATDNSSIADILVELWKCMSPEKRFNTMHDLEERAGDDDHSPAYEVRRAIYLVDQIVNVPQMIQA